MARDWTPGRILHRRRAGKQGEEGTEVRELLVRPVAPSWPDPVASAPQQTCLGCVDLFLTLKTSLPLAFLTSLSSDFPWTSLRVHSQVPRLHSSFMIPPTRRGGIALSRTDCPSAAHNSLRAPNSLSPDASGAEDPTVRLPPRCRCLHRHPKLHRTKELILCLRGPQATSSSRHLDLRNDTRAPK